MKNKVIIISITILLICTISVVAYNPIDYATVYTNENDVWHTVYDMSLIPFDAVFSESPENNISNRFNLNRSSTIEPANTIEPFSEISVNLDISINFLYSNIYHEKVLKFGEILTVEAGLRNRTGKTMPTTLYVALYNGNDILQSISVSQPVNILNSNVIQTILADIDLPQTNNDNYYIKAFVWDSVTLKPLIESVKVGSTQADYYPSQFAKSNFVDYDKVISGKIDFSGDTDYIKFIPKVTGDYVIAIDSPQTLNLTLNNSYNLYVAQNTTDNEIIAYLGEGIIYHFYVTGNSACDYNISIFPANPIYLNEAKTGTISASTDLHMYRFRPTTNATHIITSVGNTEVKAVLYDANFNVLETNSTRDGAVSFRVSEEMQLGKSYYVAISPKMPNSTGTYNLYIETPLTVTIN